MSDKSSLTPVVEALAGVREYGASGPVKAMAGLLDALVEDYTRRLLIAPEVDLPRLQLLARQCISLRRAIAGEDVSPIVSSSANR